MSGVAKRVERGMSRVESRARFGVVQGAALHWAGIPSPCGEARESVLSRHRGKRDGWRNGALAAPAGRVG